jgi:hypothetical protein
MSLKIKDVFQSNINLDDLVKSKISMAKKKTPPNLIKLARRPNPE